MQFYRDASSGPTRATRLRELALTNVRVARAYLSQLAGETDVPDPRDAEAYELLDRALDVLRRAAHGGG